MTFNISDEMHNLQSQELASTGARAFWALAPTRWNEVPLEIRALPDLLWFCRPSKMELFN